MEPPARSYHCRFLFCRSHQVLRDAWLTLGGGRVIAVGEPAAADRIDLGNVAILPGLINCHTHLEFSDLNQPLGETGMQFTDWIRAVMDFRRKRQLAAGDNRPAAIRAGLAESRAAGCIALGEIATLPWVGPEAYEELRGVVFLELLGMKPDRARDLVPAATDFISAARRQRWFFQVGLSPHAPYTVSRSTLEQLVRLSAAQRVPLAMHLAETREELQLLASGAGPFRELLLELDAWDENEFSRSVTPLAYLELLAQADRALVIHGNYLGDEEIEFLARHRDRMSVVYCPRTHAYFEHEPYPLAQMLQAGVRVVLGTDSRGSNPDLSPLRELRFAARQHPDVAPATLLRLSTDDAAFALGLPAEATGFVRGQPARPLVVPLEGTAGDDPWRLLVDSSQDATLLPIEES